MKIYFRKILLLRKSLRNHLSIDQVRKVKSLLDASIAIDLIEQNSSRKNFRKLLNIVIAI